MDQVAPISIELYNGTGEPLDPGLDVLIRIRNNRDIDQSFWHKSPTVALSVPFHDGPGDDYALTVSAKGFRDAGDFAHANPSIHPTLRIPLLRTDATFVFPPWAEIKQKYPDAARMLALGDDDPAAEARYTAVQTQKPAALASFLNLIAAMARIDLGGKTPLDFFKGVNWDNTMAQDRFFGYVDPAIIPLIRAEADKGHFAEEKDCQQFHQGSTCSYKQTDYDLANVQLTFHEGQKQTIDGVECVMIEPDIDLYKDLLAHGLLEVFPNLTSGGLTNPISVYQLRWSDADTDNGEEFDPGYEFA